MKTSDAAHLDALDTDTSIIPVLRLRRGGSPIAQWALGADDLDKLICVGASDDCDWSISAPGLAERELSFRFGGDVLHVRSERPGTGVKMNGQRLGGDWVDVPNGARLDFGTARIEVAWAIRASAAPKPRISLVPNEPELDASARDTVPAPPPEPSETPDSGVHRRPQAPDLAPQPPHEVRHHERYAADEPTIVIDRRIYEDAGIIDVYAEEDDAPQAVLVPHREDAYAGSSSYAGSAESVWESETETDEIPAGRNPTPLLPEENSSNGLRYAWIPVAVMAVWAVWITFAEL